MSLAVHHANGEGTMRAHELPGQGARLLKGVHSAAAFGSIDAITVGRFEAYKNFEMLHLLADYRLCVSGKVDHINLLDN